MSKTGRTKKTEYIAVEDLAHHLYLPVAVVMGWIADDQVPMTTDHRGRPSVPTDMIKKLSAHPQYGAEMRKALSDETREARFQSEPAEVHALKKKRIETIEVYEQYIECLTELHKKYIHQINSHPFESAPVAAYLLFSRALSLLGQGCFCLKGGYWYTGAIMREIDEVVDVAHYFIATENTEKGKHALIKWFRQNKAPKHNTCRKELAKWHAKLDPERAEKEYEALLNELYQKKSKWVHPTFSAIREVTGFRINDRVTIDSIDYGICSREYKLLELVDFFRSSIWTCFQSFGLCFKDRLPLTIEDVDLLLAYDKLFSQLE